MAVLYRQLCALALVTYIPALSLWIPSMLK